MFILTINKVMEEMFKSTGGKIGAQSLVNNPEARKVVDAYIAHVDCPSNDTEIALVAAYEEWRSTHYVEGSGDTSGEAQ